MVIKECSICMESLSGIGPICTIRCGHLFHKKCLLLIKKKCCPLCRQSFSRSLNVYLNDQDHDHDNDCDREGGMEMIDTEQVDDLLRALENNVKQATERNNLLQGQCLKLEQEKQKMIKELRLEKKESSAQRSKIVAFEERLQILTLEKNDLLRENNVQKSKILEFQSLKTALFIRDLVADVEGETMDNEMDPDIDPKRALKLLIKKYRTLKKQFEQTSEELRMESIKKEALERKFKKFSSKLQMTRNYNNNEDYDNNPSFNIIEISSDDRQQDVKEKDNDSLSKNHTLRHGLCAPNKFIASLKAKNLGCYIPDGMGGKQSKYQ